jgi:hypothetical protein
MHFTQKLPLNVQLKLFDWQILVHLIYGFSRNRR